MSRYSKLVRFVISGKLCISQSDTSRYFSLIRLLNNEDGKTCILAEEPQRSKNLDLDRSKYSRLKRPLN